MQVIKGKYTEAIVYSDTVDETTAQQIYELCSQEFAKGSRIRIMPDVHGGAGCTIGTTMTIQDKIVPNMVGVDIGCGMYVCILKKQQFNFDKLDKDIRKFIPSGFNVREVPHQFNKHVNIEELHCVKHVNLQRAQLSIGTLGGGNHFIEMNKDEEENLYLVIHSGSRHLGQQVATYYQDKAFKELTGKDSKNLVATLKQQGREKEIAGILAAEKAAKKQINKSLAYLAGEGFHEYLHDMEIAQKYAEYNRKAIAEEIVARMNFTVVDSFTTIHNYIDINERMLRKGAISAKPGERVIIPLNMRDGSIIAIGKGNDEWNQSAPHGAGRLMSRKKAKSALKLADFKDSMQGIYTTSVSADTLDEAPSAYRPKQEIIANTRDTMDIIKIIKPIYNFKAAGD